jgi:hypothetical protein
MHGPRAVRHRDRPAQGRGSGASANRLAQRCAPRSAGSRHRRGRRPRPVLRRSSRAKQRRRATASRDSRAPGLPCGSRAIGLPVAAPGPRPRTEPCCRPRAVLAPGQRQPHLRQHPDSLQSAPAATSAHRRPRARAPCRSRAALGSARRRQRHALTRRSAGARLPAQPRPVRSAPAHRSRQLPVTGGRPSPRPRNAPPDSPCSSPRPKAGTIAARPRVAHIPAAGAALEAPGPFPRS